MVGTPASYEDVPDCTPSATAQSPRLAVAGFDVHFDVEREQQRPTTNHTNRGFGGRRTVPDDMGHDGTVLQAQNYETAALTRKIIYIIVDILALKA